MTEKIPPQSEAERYWGDSEKFISLWHKFYDGIFVHSNHSKSYQDGEWNQVIVNQEITTAYEKKSSTLKKNWVY